jgi:hypothetical protein
MDMNSNLLKHALNTKVVLEIVKREAVRGPPIVITSKARASYAGVALASANVKPALST